MPYIYIYISICHVYILVSFLRYQYFTVIQLMALAQSYNCQRFFILNIDFSKVY